MPSNVPNDYDRLGNPGSLNMPLAEGARRRRSLARRRGEMRGWVKALLAMGAALVAFGVIALVIFIIAFPPFFRSLEPRYQQRLIGIFPPLDSLRPTVPFQVLPTIGGASSDDAAQQLLLTQETTSTAPAPQQTDTLLQPGQSSPVPSPTAGGIPVGAAPTPLPTPLPVYVAPTPDTQAVAPTWTPQAVAVAQVAPAVQIPISYMLQGFRYEAQGWNNCGPTTMTMALSYYGWGENQYTAARWMKPNTEDKNVSPWQMVRFVNENTGVKALYRIGGTTQLLKRLLAAGFPVIIEEGMVIDSEGWLGHYLLLVGYDDNAQQFLSFDSYLGSNNQLGRPAPYSVFDDNWRQFNRVFIVVYEPSREMELRDALAQYADPTYAAQFALETARTEATKKQDDKWAWFNMGSAYVALQDYENAAVAYDQAFRLGLPFRMLWYQFGPYEAYFRVGRYSDVLSYATASLGTTKYVEETYYWQGMVYAAQGSNQQAIQMFNEALAYNRNFFPAQEARSQVETGNFQVASVGS